MKRLSILIITLVIIQATVFPSHACLMGLHFQLSHRLTALKSIILANSRLFGMPKSYLPGFISAYYKPMMEYKQ